MYLCFLCEQDMQLCICTHACTMCMGMLTVMHMHAADERTLRLLIKAGSQFVSNVIPHDLI